MKPASHKEELRNGIAFQTLHLSCDMTKLHVDEGVQYISKVETSEDVDKEASRGVKSTFQIITQEDIFRCTTVEGIRQYGEFQLENSVLSLVVA